MKSTVVALSLAAGLMMGLTGVMHLAACEAAGPALPAAGPNAIEVTIRTEPGGGNIVVDGAPLGTSPQTVKLNPGPHRVRAAMSGYYPSPETKIQVGASEPKEITLPLVASH